MLYSEAAYFDGNHCAHCAAREEHKRIERIRTNAIKALGVTRLFRLLAR